MRLPVLRLLGRPLELPHVALNQHVAFAGAAELTLADADQIRESEDVGLYAGPETCLEVGADCAALILGEIGAAPPLLKVRERERRIEVALLLAECECAAERGHIAVAGRAAQALHALRVPRPPGEHTARTEYPVPSRPHRPTLGTPAPTDRVEMIAPHVNGTCGAEEIAPHLDAANLVRLAFVLAVEHIEIQEVIDRDVLDSFPLDADGSRLAEPRMQLGLRLSLVRRARICAFATRDCFARELELQPPPLRGGAVPTPRAVHGAPWLSASSHSTSPFGLAMRYGQHARGRAPRAARRPSSAGRTFAARSSVRDRWKLAIRSARRIRIVSRS